ncbi:glucosyl-3-phosphoglycerate synthase [Nocardioides speluncae]|uniref:glucosyl-3-phosphoglycerate synthase n=1 Tax=Nocardioides speluncae TaxID=2670337 RepID=UPI000D68E475|nr:glucosyl-3-phosphoglycerate synthase [Nocardioides speluncae]
MDDAARRWFAARRWSAEDFGEELLRDAKQNIRVSVVVPARNEADTVGEVVSELRSSLLTTGLVDELVVIDSGSSDGTAAVARRAGATVYAAHTIEAGTSPLPGKGEALWKSQFVTSGDVLAFIDADLTAWGPHFVTGLIGPLLTDESVLLVKGFYDRLADGHPASSGERVPQGGRVTELVARPLLNLYWPELAGVVQPLAGEWAIRRSLLQTLSVPVGYGVEFATLTDTYALHGLNAIAQVDLGRRGDRQQNVQDLGVMAAEILATALRRLPGGDLDRTTVTPRLHQHDRSCEVGWRTRHVPVDERPPAVLINRQR